MTIDTLTAALLLDAISTPDVDHYRCNFCDEELTRTDAAFGNEETQARRAFAEHILFAHSGPADALSVTYRTIS